MNHAEFMDIMQRLVDIGMPEDKASQRAREIYEYAEMAERIESRSRASVVRSCLKVARNILR